MLMTQRERSERIQEFHTVFHAMWEKHQEVVMHLSGVGDCSEAYQLLMRRFADDEGEVFREAIKMLRK